jgi:hypothetical protein
MKHFLKFPKTLNRHQVYKTLEEMQNFSLKEAMKEYRHNEKRKDTQKWQIREKVC